MTPEDSNGTPDDELQRVAVQAAALSPEDRGRLADYLTELMFQDVDCSLDLPDTLIDDLVRESDDDALKRFWG